MATTEPAPHTGGATVGGRMRLAIGWGRLASTPFRPTFNSVDGASTNVDVANLPRKLGKGKQMVVPPARKDTDCGIKTAPALHSSTEFGDQ